MRRSTGVRATASLSPSGNDGAAARRGRRVTQIAGDSAARRDGVAGAGRCRRGSSIGASTSLAFAFARAALAAASATCAGLGRRRVAPCFFVCLAITSRRCASLRRSSRQLARRPSLGSGAGAGLEDRRRRSAERELRREDHGEHDQREHDDDRARPDKRSTRNADPLADDPPARNIVRPATSASPITRLNSADRQPTNSVAPTDLV